MTTKKGGLEPLLALDETRTPIRSVAGEMRRHASQYMSTAHRALMLGQYQLAAVLASTSAAIAEQLDAIAPLENLEARAAEIRKYAAIGRAAPVRPCYSLEELEDMAVQIEHLLSHPDELERRIAYHTQGTGKTLIQLLSSDCNG